VSRDPTRPCGFQLRRGQRVELGGKLACQLGQNRLGLAKTYESGWSDSGRRTRSDKQQDADNPNVSSKNGPILSAFDTDHAVASSTWPEQTGVTRP
jgi:hypothetical protein